MSELRRPPRRDGPVLPTPTRLLYLAGPSPERDSGTLQQLSALTGQVHLTTVTAAAEVQSRIRGGGFHALVISHGLPQGDTLTLISALRKANVPIAIVPVVTETQRDLYASAVAVGADDVLILLGGTLLHPTETLVRVRQSRYLPAHEVEAVRAAIRRGQTGSVPAAAQGSVATAEVEEAQRAADVTPDGSPAPAPSVPGEHSPPRTRLIQPRDVVPSGPFAAPAEREIIRAPETRPGPTEPAEAAPRRDAQAALVASKLDLERAAQAHRIEREGWDRQRKELLAGVQQANDALSAERATWESRRQELERRLSTSVDARGTHEALETRLHALETQLAAATGALETERAAGREAHAFAHQQREQLTVLARARDQLEHALDAARADLRHLADTRQADHADLASVRDRTHELATELASAASVRAGLEAALEAARADLATSTRERADLDAQLNTLRSEITFASSARGELEAALAALRADLAAASRSRDMSEATLAAVRADATVAAAARADLERALDAARADRTSAISARASLEAAIDAARADVQQATGAALSAQAAADASRQALEERLADAEAAARAERTALDASVSALGADLHRAIEAGAADRLALGVATDQLRAQHAEIAAIERALADVQRTADAHAEALAVATRAKQDLATTLTEVQAERQRLLDIHRTERASWEVARKALDSRLHDLEATAAEAADLQARLAAHTEAQETERTDWLTARLALETRLSQADDELERQRDELEALGAELARVAARYDRLARSDLFGYAVTTLDGWLVHCNDAFARLLGYASAREALARASEHAFGADGTDVIGAAGLADGQVRYRDALLTRVDGASVRVLQSALLVTGPGVDPLVERVVIDLGDRTALEERLRAAQRLETLGRLTVAMAPELDALAALVDAGISAPPDPLDDRSEAVPSLATVIEIRQLLAFIRKQSRPAALVDLNEAVERVSPTLARLVSSHVEFAVRLGSTTFISADEEDFEQMVTALVVAARDWLTAGGSLVVETAVVDMVDSDRRQSLGTRSGPGAVLQVTATGYGVQLADPPSTLEAVVGRCGGTLHVGGVAGRRVTLRVQLPKIS